MEPERPILFLCVLSIIHTFLSLCASILLFVESMKAMVDAIARFLTDSRRKRIDASMWEMRSGVQEMVSSTGLCVDHSLAT